MSLPDDFKLTGKWEQKSERMGRMVVKSSDDEGIKRFIYEKVLKPYKEIDKRTYRTLHLHIEKRVLTNT